MGLPGYEFFALVGGLNVVVAAPSFQNAAVISVQSQGASLQMLAGELKEWGLEGWDWMM